MSRDHRKLTVFHIADALVLDIYKCQQFPVDERFGIRAQLRKAAVSAASNIVEGCARRTTGEYVNFLSIAAGSASEARYLVSLSGRLGYLSTEDSLRLTNRWTELSAGLQALINSLDHKP